VTDSVKKDAIEYLWRPFEILMHPNDVITRARASLMGAGVAESAWKSEMLDIFLADELSASIVDGSETESDLWDACVLAVERFYELRKAPPASLVEWNLAALQVPPTEPR
jgi:hypothetical protein